jgi:glycerol kinase
MTRHLLALDQGTSSSRAIVFDDDGTIVAMAQREFHQHYPRPGWVEHDPMEILESQLATAREALAKANLAATDLRAIGITNQRETTVLWDRRTGRPVAPAIVWQDRRGEALCAALRESGETARIRRVTGLVVDSYFSATKLKWLLDEVPGARAAAERGELAFGTVDTWLMWHLTGGRVHATDVSNASRTMLFDIEAGRWDDGLLALFDVPASVLPEVHPSAHLYGETEAGVFGAPVMIGGVAGDQQSALFGQAGFTPGLAKNTYGTGCFLLMHTGSRAVDSHNGLIATRTAQPASGTPGFALEGSVFIGGAVVQWLRDGLRAIRHSGEVEALAASVPDAGGVMVVPAFTGLGAPYWQADARGTIVGLSRGTTVAHIARAALESIAFQSAVLLEAMARDVREIAPPRAPAAAAPGGAPARPEEAALQAVTELRVDGGACVNDLLMQFQADLLGLPVVRPRVIETTALGAAYLAGLATGLYRDTDELAARWQVDRRFHPTGPREQARDRMARWEHAIRQTIAA